MHKKCHTDTTCKALTFSLILVTAVLNVSLPAEAEAAYQAELQRGIESYNSKNFGDAVSHLQFYLARSPNDSIGHYYMANCLFSLGYQKPCIDEYSKALRDSTNQKMTDYCRDAIRSMQASKQATVESTSAATARSVLATPSVFGKSSAVGTPSTLGTRSTTGSSPTAVAPQYSQEYQAIARRDALEARRLAQTTLRVIPTVADYRVPTGILQSVLQVDGSAVHDFALEKTLVRMDEQTNYRIDSLQKAAVVDQTSIKDRLTGDVYRLNRDAETRIQALNDSSRYTRGSSSLQSAIDSIRKETAAKIESAQQNSIEMGKMNDERVAQQIARAIHDCQLSQTQVIDSRRMKDTPNLQLAGTDLYTRNYLPSPSPPPPQEMVATPERLILDAHSQPGRTISRVVRDPSEPPPPPPGTDLRVHGQLLK